MCLCVGVVQSVLRFFVSFGLWKIVLTYATGCMHFRRKFILSGGT
jgi:phosphate starvation-inducible membrane PsiE